MPNFNLNFKKSGWLLAVALVLFLVAIFQKTTLFSGKSAASSATSQKPSTRSSTAAGADAPKLTEKEARQAKIAALIDQAHRILLKGDPGAIADILAALKFAFTEDGHDADAAIAAILEFLKTGKDASTGQDLTIGAGGLLDAATTLRMFLLDYLGRLSGEVGSNAAVEVAKEILSTFGSADEWAIAMRNTAWQDPKSSEFLKERVTSMLRHQPWLENPSSGMLESFDFIVHAKAVNTLPDLSSMVKSQKPPFSQAASIAVHDLAGNAPLETAQEFNQNPEYFKDNPYMRPDFFAKLDLNDPPQLAEASNYLLRQDLAPDEAKKFLSSIMQVTVFSSNKLITPYGPSNVVDAAAEKRRYESVSKAVDGWLANKDFAFLEKDLTALRKEVDGIQAHIREFEANGGQ